MSRPLRVLLWGAVLGAMTGCATVQTNAPGAQLFNAAQNGELSTLRDQLGVQDPNAQGTVKACGAPQRGTALMAAASTGSTQAVRLLLAAGADPNRQVPKTMQWPCNSYTALIFAAKSGYAEIAKLLLGGGADPSLRGGRLGGRTAAEWARHEGHGDLAGLLVEAEGMAPEQRRAKYASAAPAVSAPTPSPSASATAAPGRSAFSVFAGKASPEAGSAETGSSETGSAEAQAPAPEPAAAPAAKPAPEPRRELTPAERKALDSQL